MRGSYSNSKVRSAFTVFITVVITLSLAISPVFAAIPTYNQKGYALKPYTAKFKVVKNQKLTRARYSYKHAYDEPQLTGIYGYPAVFTRYDDDLSYKGVISRLNGDQASVQSMAVTPDGSVAYIMCVFKESAPSESSWLGYVVKYDIANKTVISKGPLFTTGHGQAMALNPKTGELWFTSAAKQVKTNLQRINTTTLVPDKRINFKLKKTIKMGNNLAFDKKGNVYFYTRNFDGAGPKNCLKIYKGKIKKKKVTFKLINQGIKYPPGQIGQSLGYNPVSNRLYFVDDGEIISVPVSKLGKLKKKHVRTTGFSGQREFESITFDMYGRGYFLTNRPYEIMTVSAGF